MADEEGTTTKNVTWAEQIVLNRDDISAGNGGGTSISELASELSEVSETVDSLSDTVDSLASTVATTSKLGLVKISTGTTLSSTNAATVGMTTTNELMCSSATASAYGTVKIGSTTALSDAIDVGINSDSQLAVAKDSIISVVNDAIDEGDIEVAKTTASVLGVKQFVVSGTTTLEAPAISDSCNDYGIYASLSDVGAVGTTIYPWRFYIRRRNTSKTQVNGAMALKLRLLRWDSTASAWTIAWQSSNSVVFNNFTTTGELVGPFNMENIDGNGGIPADEKILFVMADSASADVETALQFSCGTTTSYSGIRTGEPEWSQYEQDTENYSACMQVQYSTEENTTTIGAIVSDVDELKEEVANIDVSSEAITIANQALETANSAAASAQTAADSAAAAQTAAEEAKEIAENTDVGTLTSDLAEVKETVDEVKETIDDNAALTTGATGGTTVERKIAYAHQMLAMVKARNDCSPFAMTVAFLGGDEDGWCDVDGETVELPAGQWTIVDGDDVTLDRADGFTVKEMWAAGLPVVQLNNGTYNYTLQKAGVLLAPETEVSLVYAVTKPYCLRSIPTLEEIYWLGGTLTSLQYAWVIGHVAGVSKDTLFYFKNNTLKNCDFLQAFCDVQYVTCLDLSDWGRTIGDATSGLNFQYAFLRMYALITLNLKNWDMANCNIYTDTWQSCNALTTVIGPLYNVGKTLNANAIDLSYSPLSYESAMVFINGLYDYIGNGDEETCPTITFSETTGALLSEDDIAVATAKGWTVAY